MKFSEYFRLWLHENYYKNVANIGKSGDFYTAVSVGSLFGALLAKHFLNLVDSNTLKLPCEVVEIGANEGYLSRDFLSALVLLRPSIFKELKFFIIEPHENLRLLQRENLKEVEFSHKNSLKECKFKNAFIFCNELFDSFACELIDNENMAFVENHKIIFKKADDEILKLCKDLNLQKGELSVDLRLFFTELEKACERFIFAGFDYGVKERQNRFSLRIYQNHEVFSPFEVEMKDFFGKSDLTYNVDFEHLLKLVKEHCFKLLSFEKQSKALLDFGFDDLIAHAQNANPKLYEKWLLEAKNLLFGFDEKFHFFEFQKT